MKSTEHYFTVTIHRWPSDCPPLVWENVSWCSESESGQLFQISLANGKNILVQTSDIELVVVDPQDELIIHEEEDDA